MGKKMFMDALLLSASTDIARGCLCGISIDSVGFNSDWVRFICTDGTTLQALKVSNSHESEYNIWAFENRMPKWSELAKGMVLIPWDRQKRLKITDRYKSPVQYGADNVYPDWQRLIDIKSMSDNPRDRGWFSADTSSVLGTAKKVYIGNDKVEWIARAWKGQSGIHLDFFDTGSIYGILLGMPVRVIPDKDDQEAGSLSRLKSVYTNLVKEPGQKMSKAA